MVHLWWIIPKNASSALSCSLLPPASEKLPIHSHFKKTSKVLRFMSKVVHEIDVFLPSGNLLHSYWTCPSRNSGFSHEKWWFSIVFCMFTRPGICVFSSQLVEPPQLETSGEIPFFEVAFVMLNCGTGRWYAGISCQRWRNQSVDWTYQSVDSWYPLVN